jgi:galactosyl transferase GMA12/MNN10 family
VLATIAIGTDYLDTVAPGIASKQAYCKKQLYPFHVQTTIIDDAPPTWNKIPLLSQLLLTYSWVFMSDADVVITNPNIRLEQLISDKDITITEDYDLPFNCGNFFMRASQWSMDFLAHWWEQRKIEWNIDEQRALVRLHSWNEMELRSHMAICQQRTFNSFFKPEAPPEHSWQPGDFLAHVSNCHEAEQLHYRMDFLLHNPPSDCAGMLRTLA